MIKRGYGRIGVIQGGFDAWVHAGFPTRPVDRKELAAQSA